MIFPILGCVALLILTALVSPLVSRRAVGAVAAGGAVVAGGVGLVSSIAALVRPASVTVSLPWNTGMGASLSVGLDPLTLFFLLPIFLLTALAAVYGVGYLRHEGERRSGGAWLCTNLLAASMMVVVLARNAVLFLVAWEAMTLSSWFLVTRDHEREETRRAGVIYLVASQIGTAALLVMFLLLGSEAGGKPSLDFRYLGAAGGGVAAGVFLLALVGFGTKAGFVPLHVWLPEAHPAAPTHISALMSGVMIKTGIYGLIRVLTILGPPPAWWGWTLLTVGVASGVLGVLLALAQHDLKRLLAYHSVENIGIIGLGMGLGMLGMSWGNPAVALLGWGGALLHVLNHALFKGLLFMGAGSALQATDTREIDRLGGLARRMPVTAASFLTGSVAISGLPPLNGFLSEFLIFSGALAAALTQPLEGMLVAAVVIVALGLIGGLASACFTKAFGIVFLGEARTEAASVARESSPWLLVPMVVLSVLCLAIGLSGSGVLAALTPITAWLCGIPVADANTALARVAPALRGTSLGAAVLLGLVGALALARRLLLRRRSVASAVTWDCGYAAPTPRMQYTASSFAQPILDMFRLVLRPHRKSPEVVDLFPAGGAFSSETHDVFAHRVFRPALEGVDKLLTPIRMLQHGNLHLYVLYILVALVVLVIWAIR